MATERDGDYSHGAYYDGMRINGVVSDLKIYFKDLRGSSLIAATKELFIVQECRPSQMEIPRTEIYADISPPSTPPARGTPDEAFADMHSINAQSTLSAARTDHNSSICDVVAENHHSEERSSHQSVDCGGHLTGVQAGEEDGFLFQLLEGISEGSTVERAPQEISGCGNSDLRHPGRVLQKAAKATSGVSVPASSVEVCSENNSEVTAKTCDLVTMVDRTVLRGRDRKKFQSQPISPLKKNVVPPRQPPAKKPKAKKKTAKCGKMQKMRHQFNLSTGVGCRKRKLLESLEWTDTESSPEKKGSSGKDHVYVGVAGLAEGMIRFICKCGHPFSDDRSLDAHSKRHVNHPTQEQMKLLCPREKCGYVGLDVADFTRHVARHILMLHALGHPQKEEDSIE